MSRPPTYDPVPLKKGECFCSRNRKQQEKGQNKQHVFGDDFYAGDISSEEDENAEPSTCKCIKENERKRKRAVTQRKNYVRNLLKKEFGSNYYSVRHSDKVASSSTDTNAPMDDIKQSTPPASYDLLEQTSIDQSDDSNSDNYQPYDPTDGYDDTPPSGNERIDEEIE
jgi:hypothetical protein